MKKLEKALIAVVIIAAVVGGSALIYTRDSSNNPTSGTNTIVDMEGRNIEVQKNVDSAVSIYPMATDIVYSLQAQDELTGIDSVSPNNEMLQKIDPAISDKTKVGMPWDVNVETVLSLDPDVVLGGWGDVRQKIEDTGTPTLGFALNSFDNVMYANSMVGKCLNKKEKAESLNDYIEEEIEMIEEKTSQISQSEKVRVQFIGRDTRLSAAVQGGFQDRMLEMAGAVNVAGDMTGDSWWTKVSIEQILNWNPEVIIVPAYCKDSAENIMNDPQWQNVKAVKEEQVYTMPRFTVSWDTPVPEAVLGLMWEAKLLYPDKFADLDMAQEVEEFSSTFYDLDLSDEEIDRILNNPRSI
uniref:Iron ABC transporter substrate-binding protein n=1 Tax=uncultured organism TaxID=155900 RepID=M1QBQ6_9ZZZZ|nr:iron ABC transporter substrate-binding protein [uncultured organism]